MLEQIENFMRIAKDTKKVFVYNKSDGLWYWHDKDSPETLYAPNDTFLDCLVDAVSPYISEGEEELFFQRTSELK